MFEGARRRAIHRVVALPFACALSLSIASADAEEAPSLERCGAAFEEAQSLRSSGKLRAARAELSVCGSESCPAEIIDRCVAWLGEVDAAMPSIVIVASDAEGHDTLAVKVSSGAELIADGIGVHAVELDPGTHLLRFEVDGSPSIEKTVVLREGQKNVRVDVAFARPSVPAPVLPHPVVPRERPLPRPEPLPEEPDGGPSPLAYLGFGLGGAGLIVGVAAGIAALVSYDDVEALCASPAGCSQEEIDDAAIPGHVATGGFVAFGVGAAAGVIILFATWDL